MKLELDLDQALPGLRATREAGKLVPFVGLGVSRPFCRDWAGFITKLASDYGSGQPLNDHNPDGLARAGDRVAARLSLEDPLPRYNRILTALREGGVLPPQSVALVAGYWPLMITTNYDDLLVVAAQTEKIPAPHVLGRSQADCAKVVRSLEQYSPPYLWAIQGHLPGVFSGSVIAGTISDDLVIGHQQYQQAINGNPSLRRGFAEVYRRRSLLFVGSGINENYVVNLISEALFMLGPSPHAHYALFPRSMAKTVDVDFLAVRLGVTTVWYGDTFHDLPSALNKIAISPGGKMFTQRTSGMSRLVYRVPRGDAGQEHVEVELSLGGLAGGSRTANSGDTRCLVFSVGLSKDGEPIIGNQFLSYYGRRPDGLKTVKVACFHEGILFQVLESDTETDLFLLAARAQSTGSDARALDSISIATRDALVQLESRGFQHVSMGLLAAGPQRMDNPTSCLVAQLAGLRDFCSLPATAHGSWLRSVTISIVAPDVWSSVEHGRVLVGDILTSRVVRVLVRVSNRKGEREEFALSVPLGSTVKHVVDVYYSDTQHIDATAWPLPKPASPPEILDLGVFPGMIIEVSPKPCP
jgi:hypothetical protein